MAHKLHWRTFELVCRSLSMKNPVANTGTKERKEEEKKHTTSYHIYQRIYDTCVNSPTRW
jgi:hypothetical protein